jgi:hypothetical protein
MATRTKKRNANQEQPAPTTEAQTNAATPEAPASSAAGPEPAAANAAPGPVGVKLRRSRAFLAGALLREVGLDVGVTDEMVAKIDALYEGGKKPNPVQTRYDLSGAWAVLKGYVEGKLE